MTSDKTNVHDVKAAVNASPRKSICEYVDVPNLTPSDEVEIQIVAAQIQDSQLQVEAMVMAPDCYRGITLHHAYRISVSDIYSRQRMLSLVRALKLEGVSTLRAVDLIGGQMRVIMRDDSWWHEQAVLEHNELPDGAL